MEWIPAFKEEINSAHGYMPGDVVLARGDHGGVHLIVISQCIDKDNGMPPSYSAVPFENREEGKGKWAWWDASEFISYIPSPIREALKYAIHENH